MLFGIGCDIEEISRFNKLVAMDEFVDLVFLPLEADSNTAVPDLALTALPFPRRRR